jgi:hypothetical protein
MSAKWKLYATITKSKFFNPTKLDTNLLPANDTLIKIPLGLRGAFLLTPKG